jgi:hypothetical protein
MAYCSCDHINCASLWVYSNKNSNLVTSEIIITKHTNCIFIAPNDVFCVLRICMKRNALMNSLLVERCWLSLELYFVPKTTWNRWYLVRTPKSLSSTLRGRKFLLQKHIPKTCREKNWIKISCNLKLIQSNLQCSKKRSCLCRIIRWIF